MVTALLVVSRILVEVGTSALYFSGGLLAAYGKDLIKNFNRAWYFFRPADEAGLYLQGEDFYAVGEIDLRDVADRAADAPAHAHQTAFDNGQYVGHLIYSVTLLLPVTVVVGLSRIFVEVGTSAVYFAGGLLAAYGKDLVKNFGRAWYFFQSDNYAGLYRHDKGFYEAGEIDLRDVADRGDDKPAHGHQTAFNNGQRLGHVIYSVTLLLPVTVVVGLSRIFVEVGTSAVYFAGGLLAAYGKDLVKNFGRAWYFFQSDNYAGLYRHDKGFYEAGEIDLRDVADRGDDKPAHAHQTAFDNGQRLGHVIYSVTLLLPVTVVVGLSRIFVEVGTSAVYFAGGLLAAYGKDLVKNFGRAWYFFQSDNYAGLYRHDKGFYEAGEIDLRDVAGRGDDKPAQLSDWKKYQARPKFFTKSFP